MKKTLKPMLLTLFFTLFLSIVSCNNEELFIEPEMEVVDEDTDDTTEEENTPEDPDTEETTEVDTDAPCDFDLNNVEPNSTIVINCALDLEGTTVNLPNNVTLVYEGGEITNGTISFSEGNVIDGNLLNSTVTISGSTPQLKDPSFDFIPSRWGIVEGEVPRDVAYNNHLIIQNIIDLTKELGVNTFKIDKLDAFFESANGGPHRGTAVMTLPSNFHLKMTNNTVLRVFPVLESELSSNMIRIGDEKHITVSGGVIIGDRLQRGAVGGGNVTFSITGGQHIIIDNVTTKYSSSAGITINSILFPGNSGYIPSKDVLITNCIFDSNRANNLSITDGEDIIVENCKSYRAGNDVGSSTGIAPRIGIVIEPAEGQKVDRVILRNNEIRETASGTAILAVWADDVLITGNRTDGSVGWTTASNVKVIDNPDVGGIGGGYDGWPNTGGIISGNTVNNSASAGIYATSDGIEIFNNVINNCKSGIFIKSLKTSNIYNNTISSNVENAFGFIAQTSLDNVNINNNIVNVENGRSFLLEGVIANQVIFKGNDFDCGNDGKVLYSNGFDFIENEFLTSGFGISNSSNININKNTLKANSQSPVFWINSNSSSKNITVTNNIFNHKNSVRLSCYGIKINTVGSDYSRENSNILIKNNVIETLDENYGIHSTNFNGLTIEGNTIQNNGDNCCAASIYFRGNNSTIEGNAVNKDVDIDGVNNNVNNN